MINLTPREKRLLKILAAVAGCLIFYFAVIYPITELMSSLDREYESNLTKVSDLDKIYEQYNEINQARLRYEGMIKNERGITSVIEENAAGTNILKNRIHTMNNPVATQGKYKKISTEVKFEGVDIKSILDFLYRMQNASLLVSVSNLRISQALKGRNVYDVSITFESLSE